MTQILSSTRQQRTNSAGKELSRIISAAVINRKFREMLLNDPAKAISIGYSGEKFKIDGKEKNRLSRIQAASLSDFAIRATQI